MSKLLGVCVLSALCLATSAGCRMCCPSYDYNEPMGPFDQNDEHAGNVPRYGSAFGGSSYVQGSYETEGMMIEESVPSDYGSPREISTPRTPTPQMAPPMTERSATRTKAAAPSSRRAS